MLQDKTFRSDLYYRVKAIEIAIPPLRERRTDIVPLANYLFRKYAALYGRPASEIHPLTMEMLISYDWPGNVRELEHVIQHGVALSQGPVLHPEALPVAFKETHGAADAVPPVGESFAEQLTHWRLQLIEKTIAECGGNKAQAARRLRITRAYLHRLLRMRPTCITEGHANGLRDQPLAS